MLAYDLLGVKKDACDLFGDPVGSGSLRDWLGDTVGLPLMSETGSSVVGRVLGPSLSEIVVDSSTTPSSTAPSSTAPSSTATSAKAL